MKTLKKIGLGLAALILVFVVVVATRPSTFHYERSITHRGAAGGRCSRR